MDSTIRRFSIIKSCIIVQKWLKFWDLPTATHPPSHSLRRLKLKVHARGWCRLDSCLLPVVDRRTLYFWGVLSLSAGEVCAGYRGYRIFWTELFWKVSLIWSAALLTRLISSQHCRHRYIIYTGPIYHFYCQFRHLVKWSPSHNTATSDINTFTRIYWFSLEVEYCFGNLGWTSIDHWHCIST